MHVESAKSKDLYTTVPQMLFLMGHTTYMMEMSHCHMLGKYVYVTHALYYHGLVEDLVLF